MNQLQVQEITQREIDNWDYEASVKATTKKVAQHRRLSLEIVREVFIANEWFAVHGSNRFLTQNNIDVPNGTSTRTFSTYLEEIGLPRRTAYNWLERFVPEENRLLSPEELKAAKQQRALDDWEARQKRLEFFRDSGKKPSDWTAEDEKEWLKEASERGLSLTEDPMSDIATRKRAAWERVFSSRRKRKDDKWSQKELDFWELEDVEPVRSLARQLKSESELRREKSEELLAKLNEWSPKNSEESYLKSDIEVMLRRLGD